MKRDIDVSASWRRSARAILVHRLRKVLVVGALDRVGRREPGLF